MEFRQRLNYHWAAVHQDGRITHQTNEKWSPLTIESDDIVEIRLIPQTQYPEVRHANLKEVAAEIDLEAGERFFCFKRKLFKMHLGGAEELLHGYRPGMNCCHIIGIERKDGTKTYLFVRPNGNVMMRTSKNGE